MRTALGVPHRRFRLPPERAGGEQRKTAARLDHDPVSSAQDFHVVGSAPLAAAVVHARVRAFRLDGAIEHGRALRPGVPNPDCTGMSTNIDIDALEVMAEGDVRLLLTPFRLLLARRVVARLRPDPHRDLRLGRIGKAFGILGQSEDRAFPLCRAEHDDLLRFVPIVLGSPIGLPGTIQLPHLLLTGKGVGDEIGPLWEETGQTMVPRIVDGSLDGRGRVDLASWIGRVWGLGDVE